VTIDVLEQRAELEDAIKGRTLCDQLLDAVQKWGDLPAFSDRDDGDWQTISWAQTRQQVLELAAGFRALGLAPGDRVALMLPNRLEHVLADQAAVHAAGVPVTFYATFAPDQVGYVAGDCDARVAVLDGADELARWEPVLGTLPGLKKIIVRDPGACPSGDLYLSWPDFAELGRQRFAAEPEAVHELIRSLTPGHPASVLYTSGTTGNPKGVVITHHNVLYELMTATVSGLLVPHIRWVSYLPLAHIAERMFTIYLAVHTGGHVYFCHTASTDLVRTVGDVKPNSFFGVPRVWEKIQAGLQAVLAMESDPAKRAAIEAAMKTGRRYVESCQFGQSTPDELAEQFRAADEAILRPIRSLLGLGDAEVVLSAAAPLPLDVAAFFASLGMTILDVYGMTETTGAFTSNTPAAFKLGTVGRAVAGMEITIAEDGEILTRGPLDTPGYLNQPERTADLIDADGWLHTGDIGSLDADGFLSVVDRKKELIITSGGENISPAAIENLLVAHPLIGQALAYGNDRRFVVALLTLDGEVAPAWAKARGIDGSLAELAEHPTVLEVVAEAVAGANARLARVQQVKTWRLLPVEWTAESEELTPTLKLKRRVVHAKYADIIDSLYGG
jgi:long-chain acyl-CoA synthetase